MATFKDLLRYFENMHLSDISEDGINILFREKERNFILNFFGSKTSVPYPSLFIYGHTATGKTYFMSNIMKELELPHAWVNCLENNTSKLIFKSISQQLCDNSDYLEKSYNNCEFVNFIKKTLKDKMETTYLIFDSVEALNKEDTILPILLRLQDLTKSNVCTIFISELPWTKYRNITNSLVPIALHFPNYSRDEIIEILSNDCPDGYSKTFYEGYINVILKTFFTVTRNLRELRHLAEINFEKYCEPLAEDPDIEVSNLRLWKNIEPTLRKALSSVYVRDISGSMWKSHCKQRDDSDIIDEKLSSFSTAKYSLTKELPFYSKFLLLSAYFASYNQPKTDFKHFVKNQGKQKKKRITKKLEKNRHLLGPKPFTLDRMLSIFFSIVGERVLPSAMIFSQISSLVSMRLVSRVSLDDQLDCPKYKCIAELDLVEKIGKTINIDVMGYLDDFL